MIGLLHSRDPSFFNTYTPGNFSTIATPVSSQGLTSELMMKASGYSTVQCVRKRDR